MIILAVTVLIISNEQLLLARRRKTYGHNTWDSPGGKIEKNETALQCALRETKEEAGLELNKNNFIELGFTEDFLEEDDIHSISIVMMYHKQKNEIMIPKKKEPHKFYTNWHWFPLDKLPNPLFLPVENALKQYGNKLTLGTTSS